MSDLSFPASKMVCGYEIKKCNLGKYLEVMEKIRGFPDEFAAACFPGKNLAEIAAELATADSAMVGKVIDALLTSAPDYLLDIISHFTDIPKDLLIMDENLGPSGVMGIVDAFIEVNDLENFISRAAGIGRRLAGAIGHATRGSGSNT